MIPQTDNGAWLHCAICGGPLFVRYAFGAIDYMTYCKRCAVLGPITEDQVIDAFNTLDAITLMATFLRLLGVREVYFRDP